MVTRNIGIVGTGFIAEVHAEAIASHPDLHLIAVTDVNAANAEAFAAKWRVDHVFADAEALAASGTIDAVHILTPPDSHAALSALFLQQGIATFTEKPVATGADDLAALANTVSGSDAAFGVNQNSLFHPAFEKLLAVVQAGKLGPIQSIQCHYAAALRQLESGQFGHWMFAKPINILFEQAVHPLAQIQYLVGPFTDIQAMNAPPMEIGDGRPFFPTTLMNLQGERISAQLHFSVGVTYPHWEISVLCSDGIAIADMISNRMIVHGRSKWLEASDHFLTGRAAAKQYGKQSKDNFLTYAVAMIGLKGRRDSFYLSMAGSIANFYNGLNGTSDPRGTFEFARGLIDACLVAADQMDKLAAPAKERLPARAPRSEVDVVILGGTGFIGRYVVERCIERGMTVRVIARGTHNLPAIFQHTNVDVMSADLRDAESAQQAVKGTKQVINLAHGGGGANAEQILKAMLGSAEAVFEACKNAGVSRLIHIGSIAGMYLGNSAETITGATPPDPEPNKRADYARAKAYTDLRMLELNAGDGPDVTILRPGIVVGRGTPAAHSGLGIFNNDQHCLGWSDGTVKLPFVLVQDVADAIVASLNAQSNAGKCYNLCGDVRWTAQEYFEALRKATGRPFAYHGQNPRLITWIENLKILIKRIGGKKQPFHSIRDFKSRAMYADFDCSDTKEALSWTPVADAQRFYEQAIAVHATISARTTEGNQ